MATATKTAANGKAKGTKAVAASPRESSTSSVLRPIRRQRVTFRIKGLSPLIHHKWSEKSKEMMRYKHAGKKTKSREVRDPKQEGIDATHYTEDGKYGIFAGAVKRSIINAAHKDIGIEKTLVRKSLFVVCDDRNNVIPMDCDEPVIQEDVVRVGQGSTDLRYRPYFYKWAADITCEIDAEMLRVDDLLTLVDRAGFGVGLHEFRPEKSGDFGRFQIDNSRKVEVQDI